MKHYRQLLYLVILLVYFQNAYAQQFRLGGMLKTSTSIDSLTYQESRVVEDVPKKILTSFRSKTGKLKLNLELDILYLSHLRPLNSEAIVHESAVLTQKRTQVQLKLGLVFFLRDAKSKKKAK